MIKSGSIFALALAMISNFAVCMNSGLSSEATLVRCLSCPEGITLQDIPEEILAEELSRAFLEERLNEIKASTEEVCEVSKLRTVIVRGPSIYTGFFSRNLAGLKYIGVFDPKAMKVDVYARPDTTLAKKFPAKNSDEYARLYAFMQLSLPR